MTTTVHIPSSATAAKIEKLKLAPQAKEIISYLIKTYGYDTEVDQTKLILDLNAQQNTGAVLSKGSAGPISRLFEFYRKKGFVDNNLLVVTKSVGAGKSELAKVLEELKSAHAELAIWRSAVGLYIDEADVATLFGISENEADEVEANDPDSEEISLDDVSEIPGLNGKDPSVYA